ncbi:uncharacterized protein LOC144619849 isoform X2 [Crassostrea virginica]
MEMSCKELETKFSGDIKKRELELISIIIRKVVIVNTRTGEITWNPRSSESSTSREARGYNVKKSLSDGVLETKNDTHVTKTTSKQISAIKDLQDGKSAEANVLSQKIRDDKARAARLKQIEDFFTDPVDREIFPKEEAEPPIKRKIPTKKIQSIRESVDLMLAQFTCAMRDENFMEEVYKYRVFRRPQSSQVMPPASEMLPSPLDLDSSTPGQNVPPPGLESTTNCKIPTELQQDIAENQRDQIRTEFCSDGEKSVHKISWFARFFCCVGSNSSSKKHKARQESKKKGREDGFEPN